MPRVHLLLLLALLLPPATSAQSSADDEPPDTRSILEHFASDYARDPMAQDITFGIRVGDQYWHVVSERDDAGERRVHFHDGLPDEPTFYFTLSRETLARLDAGDLSGITASGAATSAEKTPLDSEDMDGFDRPDWAEWDPIIRPLIFHFWTRGTPEIVPFGVEHSRIIHGAPATGLYYFKDFRSAVYHIPPGIPDDVAPTITVPFPRLLIILEGSMEGHVGGSEFTAQEGEMVLFPSGIPAWFNNNTEDEMLSLVWLMFGDGA
ncbi:MAG: cupin domain-containing protein [Bacteroidota bacterium]